MEHTVAPSRERELKHCPEEKKTIFDHVAPSRERELKPGKRTISPWSTVAPSRERELKLEWFKAQGKGYQVAPSRERELKPRGCERTGTCFKSLPHGSVN